MWIPQKNENSQRARRHQSSPQTRPQKTQRLGFPKTARILTRAHYINLSKNSKKFIGNTVAIDYRRGTALGPKLGITVSRRFGKAHLRNRFKRLVREAFRLCYADLPAAIEMNISPRTPEISLEAIKNDILHVKF